ncbi:MAG TPA: FecR family protein, partial [Planctomycetota bacterium]|nr:FecR family protein [Planctomycetota bacterium]
MNPEEIHRLVEEYRDGTIPAADARRLADAIRRDPAVAAAVRKALAFSGHLGQAVDAAGDDSFARSFAERLQAERGGAEFVNAFEKRTSNRLTSRSRRIRRTTPSLVPFLVAAAFVLAVVGLVVYTTKQPAPRSVAQQTLPPPPPPEEPKRAPEPPQPTPELPKPAPEEPKTVAPQNPTPPPPAKPQSAPDPAPAPPVEEPKPAPVKPTEVAPATAVAKIDRVEGDVFVVVEGERKPARSGQPLLSGMAVTTGLGQSGASLVLADGTRFGIGADASLREIVKGPRGTRVVLNAGTLVADVSKQPAEQPLVFATPHGEARVLGTVLRLIVDFALTRLEVKEGKVRLTREGKSVDVAAGQYAVAGKDQPLIARSVSPDEIVLIPQQAKLTGAEWSLIPDPKSLSRSVLEAGVTAFKVTDHVETRPSYATFTFYAPADKEYRIWIRAMSQEKGDPWNRDMVTIEPTRVTMSQKSPFFGAAPTTAYVVTGVSATPGYSWISSHGEEGKVEPPLIVKFHETGFQNIRVYV